MKDTDSAGQVVTILSEAEAVGPGGGEAARRERRKNVEVRIAGRFNR